MIVLSPEVRAFCEENTRKIAGKAPRFQTMADAWIFLIFQGIKSGSDDFGPVKKTKDAFRWRTVKSNFQSPLILHGILKLEMDLQMIHASTDRTADSLSQILNYLEACAHNGAQSMKAEVS